MTILVRFKSRCLTPLVNKVSFEIVRKVGDEYDIFPVGINPFIFLCGVFL